MSVDREGALRKYLEAMAGLDVPSTTIYAEYLLREGELFKPTPMVPEIKEFLFFELEIQNHPNRMGECYHNAQNLALQAEAMIHDRLWYCEGIAIPSFVGPSINIPVMHGWNMIDQFYLHDQTWQDNEDCVYFGVRIPASQVMKHWMEKGMASPIIPCMLEERSEVFQAGQVAVV